MPFLPFLILILFISVPLAEIAVFIAAGDAIGILPTILAVIVTAIVGTYLLQRQGLSALARTRSDMDAGRVPIGGLIDGIYLLLAGALLLTPGFITDAIGFLLFVPPFRRAVGKYVLSRLTRGVIVTETGGHHREQPGGPSRSGTARNRKPGGAGPIIDGDYSHVDPGTEQPSASASGSTKSSAGPGAGRPSGWTTPPDATPRGDRSA
ncbi:MAG: FxsA family protein [Pseudomonadota bacterium]